MNRHPAVAGPTPLLSYRALLRLDAVANLLLATSLARLAERMFGLSVVLYGLERFHAPQLAGWAACAAMAPGLLVGPLARALLDRIGAAWAIALDMACSAGCILVLALLCLARADNAVSLLTLVVLYSLSTPLSAAGVRTLLFQQHRQSCRCQRYRTILRLRPDEPAFLKPLAEQTQALSVPAQNLDQVTAPAAEHEQLAAERVLAELLLHLRRQTIEAPAHVGVSARQPHMHIG